MVAVRGSRELPEGGAKETPSQPVERTLPVDLFSMRDANDENEENLVPDGVHHAVVARSDAVEVFFAG